MPQWIKSVAKIDLSPRGKVQPSPADWRDHMIYQVLVDRFDDNQDHPPYDPKTTQRGRDEKNGHIFQGGKIKGITRRLDYIRGLGCNTIWISPPFKNRQGPDGSYDGYGIQDFLSIDPRFGTTEDLRELCEQAHRRDMYIVLDIVIHHTGNNWSYPGDHGEKFNETGQYPFADWRGRDNQSIPPDQTDKLGPDDGVWPVELQNPDCYKRRGEIRDLTHCGDEERTNGDFYTLKTLDLGKPEVMDAILRCHKYWIAAVDCDGFRLDTVTNTDPEAVVKFCDAIHEFARSIGKQNFLLFGEIIGNDQMLRQYVRGSDTSHPSAIKYPCFNAVLDFPLYFILEEIIKGFTSPRQLVDRAANFQKFYTNYGEAGKHFISFLDNHDQIARPFRRFMHQVGDPRQAIVGVGYLLTTMGIPCIYYGTEQGFDGGGDNNEYVREAMFGGTWGAFDTTGMQVFNSDNSIYQGIAKIAKVREKEPVLRYGREYYRQTSADGKSFGFPNDGKCTLAYSRILDVTEILVAINITAEKRNDWIEVDNNLTPSGKSLKDLLTGQTFKTEQTSIGSAVRLPIDARQIMILRATG